MKLLSCVFYFHMVSEQSLQNQVEGKLLALLFPPSKSIWMLFAPQCKCDPMCADQCLSPWISTGLWAQTKWVGKREMVLKLLGKNVNIFSVFTHQILERLLMFSKGKFPISFTISRIKPCPLK